MDVNLKVLDLSHHNCGPSGDPDNEIDFAALYAYGVRGIIHKATQGIGNVDHKYDERREQATAAGMLWGAYHFATGDDVDAQVKHFIETAKPDSNTLMALDHEPNGGNQLDLLGAQAFLESLSQQIGRKAVIYSGNLIKEQTSADDHLNDFFAQYRLWLCQYGPTARLPDPWDNYWLWQFAGDGTGSRDFNPPGLYRGNKTDMNTFAGSDAELAAGWA